MHPIDSFHLYNKCEKCVKGYVFPYEKILMENHIVNACDFTECKQYIGRYTAQILEFRMDRYLSS